MALKLTNNASGSLATAVAATDTGITLKAGEGAEFPALAAGDWFPVTVVDANDPSRFEIVRCTARTTDTLTVARAQEGTSALAFAAGDLVELRLTAAAINEFVLEGEGLTDNVPQVYNETDATKKLRIALNQLATGVTRVLTMGNADFLLEYATKAMAEGHTDNQRLMTALRVFEAFSKYGLGVDSYATTTNLNQLSKTGIYKYTGISEGEPAGGTGIVLHLQYDATYPRQFAFDLDASQNMRLFYRFYDGGLATPAWQDWIEIWHSANPATKDEIIAGTNNTKGVTPLRVQEKLEETGLINRVKNLAVNTDLNTVTENGFYDVSDPVNGPGAGWWYVEVIRHSNGANSDYVKQVATRLNSATPEKWWRTKAGATALWNAWKKDYDDASITDVLDFTYVYPNGGSAASPAKLAGATTYVNANPWPGFAIYCEHQVRWGGVWGNQGHVGAATSYGGRAWHYVSGTVDEIRLTTGNYVLAGTFDALHGFPGIGGSMGWTDANYTGSRVKVYKLKGKN